MGTRETDQPPLWIAASDLPASPGHPFYTRLTAVLEAPGFDRFVLQFDSFVPTYTVKRQSAPLFTLGGSGQPVTLSGTAGALVRVHSATGANTFVGSTDLSHGEYPVLKEARQTEDFEGYVGWALGLSKEACLRTFTLTEPARLVVDFSTASS